MSNNNTVKFFDGMDDDGSELNLQKFMFLLDSYVLFGSLFEIPNYWIHNYERGMLFQILETMGNSLSTVKMEESEKWRKKILLSRTNNIQMRQMCFPRETRMNK